MLIAFSVLRFILFAFSFAEVGWNAGPAFVVGLIQDFQVIVFIFAITYVGRGLVKFARLAFLRLRAALGRHQPPNDSAREPRASRQLIFILTAAACFIFILLCCAEVFFWREFETRPNFIAVDYLVYTNEVWENIWQSYHVLSILFLIFAIAVMVARGALPTLRRWQQGLYRKPILFGMLVLLALSFLQVFTPDAISGVQFRRELASNGWKTFVQAYFQNEIDYRRFYQTLPNEKVHQLIAKPEMAGQLGAWIKSNNPQVEKLNVVLVVIESLSRRYLSEYGEKKHLTPTMDRLYNAGVAFSNLYATGTRTVRGLEAVFLGVPPTPGQSILRRPGFENLYSLGSYLKRAGYQNQFLYGGYGVFDNMGPFFAANTMEIHDRSTLRDDQVTFENAWGVCDEDMFNVAIEQADKMAQTQRPFFQLIMTTSNHRPFTYPSGKVEIPSGSGRDGAVEYTDFAIGEFLKKAESKPWFSRTVFVFVADHNASVAGRVVLPVHDFPIPFVLYAPNVLKPQRIDQLSSQMDVAPTILDAIGFSYKNHFFGKSLLQPISPRAFISTYQSMGYFKDNILTVLKPKRYVGQFDEVNDDEVDRKNLNRELVDEAIAYYQQASEMFESQQLKNTGDDKIEFEKLKTPRQNLSKTLRE